MKAMVARLEDEDSNVRKAIVWALGVQSSLPTVNVTSVVAQLENEDGGVRRAALEALRGQSNLPEATVTSVVAQLENEDGGVRKGRLGGLAWPIEPPRGDCGSRGGTAEARGCRRQMGRLGRSCVANRTWPRRPRDSRGGTARG